MASSSSSSIAPNREPDPELLNMLRENLSETDRRLFLDGFAV